MAARALPYVGKVAAPSACPLLHRFVARGLTAVIPLRLPRRSVVLCKVNARGPRCDWAMVLIRGRLYYFLQAFEGHLILHASGLVVQEMKGDLEGEYWVLSGQNRTCLARILLTAVGPLFFYRFLLVIPGLLFVAVLVLMWDWLIKPWAGPREIRARFPALPPMPRVTLARRKATLSDCPGAGPDRERRERGCTSSCGGGRKPAGMAGKDSELEKGLHAIVRSFYKYAEGPPGAKAPDQAAFQKLLSNELSHQLTDVQGTEAGKDLLKRYADKKVVSFEEYWELVAFVCQTIQRNNYSKRGKKLAERAGKCSELEQGLHAIVGSFYKYAKEKGGAQVLDQAAFQKLLSNELSHQLTGVQSTEAGKDLLKKMDTDNNQLISFEEYWQLVAFICHIIQRCSYSK
ncbi:LOW QUALITY PROTEIN: uncharacterized protein ACDP82_016003 [Pangshura tecta]